MELLGQVKEVSKTNGYARVFLFHPMHEHGSLKELPKFHLAKGTNIVEGSTVRVDEKLNYVKEVVGIDEYLRMMSPDKSADEELELKFLQDCLDNKDFNSVDNSSDIDRMNLAFRRLGVSWQGIKFRLNAKNLSIQDLAAVLNKPYYIITAYYLLHSGQVRDILKYFGEDIYHHRSEYYSGAHICKILRIKHSNLINKTLPKKYGYLYVHDVNNADVQLGY